MKLPVGHRVDQEIKVNIISNGTNPHHVHVEGCSEKHPAGTFIGENPAKGAQPESNYEEIPEKSRLMAALHNRWPVILKSAKVIKVKDRLSRSYLISKVTKGMWQLNGTQHSELNP